MEVSIILAILKNYWRVLLPLAAVAFIGLYGYHLGAKAVHAEWDASNARQKVLVQEQKDRLQANIAKLSADYQKWHFLAIQAMNKNKGALTDEIKKNAGLRDCLATDEFVRIFNEVR